MNKSRYSYRHAIEETIANAKSSRSLETVKASDGGDGLCLSSEPRPRGGLERQRA